jgi:iron complex outermembrane receptor protein
VSVEVVDQQLIQDKAILAPSELANVVSGVQASPGLMGNAGGEFLIRGFVTNGINYRDGFRVQEKDAIRDMANVERVEFVKGPASVLYGSAQPGGAVNTITKQAVDYNFGYADIQAGSYDFFRSTVDLNQVLGDVAVRLNLAGNTGNSFVDFESSNNYLIAPAAKWKITKDTELSYSGEFQKTNVNGQATGLPNINGVANLPQSSTLGEPWTRASNLNATNQLNFKSKLNDEWTFRQGLYSGRNQLNTSTALSSSMSPSGNNGLADLGRGGQDTLTSTARYLWQPWVQTQKNTASQTEMYGTLKHGDVTHKLLAGYEYTKTTWNQNSAYDYWDQVNLNSPTYKAQPTPPLPDGFAALYNMMGFGPYTLIGFTQNMSQSSNAFYLQDQISYAGWRLLAGARNENVNASNVVGGDMGAYSTSGTQGATTGRVGLLYMITPATSAYYSWSQSFNSNATYPSSPTSPTLLPASRGVQNELGLKHTFWTGLDGTVSLFNITKTNVPYSITAFTYGVNGQQQSQGWEASLIGQATSSLRLIANATGLNAKITQDSVASNVGQNIYGVPNFSANIWGVQDLKFDIPGKLSFGLGAVYVGQRAGATPNTNAYYLPEYTSFDAGIFYKIDKVNLALNVKNLTNATILNSAQGALTYRSPGTNYLLTAGIHF